MAAITTQPGSYPASDFQTGLCDFFSDCKTCCYGWWCFPCMTCSIASDMDECCLCGATMAMRTMYRTRYNIRGSLCQDYCAVMWCYVCSACQVKRDIDLRKEQRIF
ncbi:placenta-specific gene 8 protein [Esox lucius]|uniref:Placenta associated 8, tandem duplicate 1 n=1 Tax=Esox lucius TaxID=8010 RepID=A0A3P8XEK0_ESOLU|nr:placenta-specific gene 8 protein [Esox lucius]XP_010862075.2 placenta-specific gene 8 protein [Esox lucius]